MNTQEDADDRYNRLMDYLDAAEEIRVSKKELRADASPNRLNRSPGRNYVINVSTPPSKNNREMQSPNSGKNSNSGSKTTSGTKRYVWDEVDELDNNEWTSNSPSSSLPPPPSYRSSSSNNMNSPPAGRYSPSRLHHHVSSSSPTKDRSFVSNSDVASVSSPSALSETVDSLRRKIEAMKDELKERNGEIRDVQAELVRLGAARDRRTQKYQSHWEDKLRNLTDEQGKIVKRNLELLSRLRDDVKQLEAKEVALENKLASSRSNAESSIEVISVTAQRRREKAKRHVESEERLMLEKVAVTKLESMKTQAAKLLGAKLDALVIRGKETVSVRTEELDAKFMSLKLQLQAELDTKFSESVGMLRAEQQDTTDKQRHQLERQLEEVKRRHQTELGSLQERLIRTRKALEEKCERGLSIDAEAALENLRAVRAAEAKQVTELTERHQRDLSALLRSHADEKATFEKQRKEDTEKWRQQRQSELKEHMERMRQRKRDIHAAKAAADTERIVSRLRSEADTERRRLVSSKETELESIREHAQEQLDSLRDAERRSYERLAGLRSEVESLRRKNDSLVKEEPALSQELATSKNTLRDLRITLREVEAEVGAVDGRLQQEALSLRKHLDDEHRHWEEKLAAATDNLQVQRARHEKAVQVAQASHKAERTRIEAKVAVLLQRKDAAATDLEVQLADLQQSAHDLEERLEEVRVNKFK